MQYENNYNESATAIAAAAGDEISPSAKVTETAQDMDLKAKRRSQQNKPQPPPDNTTGNNNLNDNNRTGRLQQRGFSSVVSSSNHDGNTNNVVSLSQAPWLASLFHHM